METNSFLILSFCKQLCCAYSELFQSSFFYKGSEFTPNFVKKPNRTLTLHIYADTLTI